MFPTILCHIIITISGTTEKTLPFFFLLKKGILKDALIMSKTSR